MIPKLIGIALPVLLALDMLWLGVIARAFYRQQMGGLLSPTVNWGAALAFYALFLVGLVVFVIAPAVEKQSWLQALRMGAFFGLVTYATYDLTNYAVIKDWPLPLTIVDMAWGAALSAGVATITTLIATRFA